MTRNCLIEPRGDRACVSFWLSRRQVSDRVQHRDGIAQDPLGGRLTILLPAIDPPRVCALPPPPRPNVLQCLDYACLRVICPRYPAFSSRLS